MDNDDSPQGRILTRREALAVLGATGVAVLAGCARRTTTTSDTTGVSTSCVARPQETQGPYFVDDKLDRSDIRLDPSDGTVKPGAQLQLTFNVSRAISNGCTPLTGVLVDVWHCDALGVYSDVSDPGFDTVGKTFLRGYQVTDATGAARFTTIYPGWYQGRAVHMHFKIRSASSSGPGFEFTSQLYFDDALTDQVHAQQPYATKGQRTVRNAGDGIYRQNGSQLRLAVNQNAAGYAATFGIALQTA
ncbi:MAG: intradiol ring-cleavage dioxygenase [Gemmatimonadota bacterium]|nr:intradiol ring-cleavage dioxygenase [Gemmatimonadota bacterium]